MKLIFTIQEAAHYKGMEYEAFRYYCAGGRGPKRNKLGSRWIFNKKDLDGWDVNKIKMKRGAKKK